MHWKRQQTSLQNIPSQRSQPWIKTVNNQGFKMRRQKKMKRNEENACPFMVVGSSNASKTRALMKPILFSDKSLDKRNLITEKPILKITLSNPQAEQPIIVLRDRFCNHSSSVSLLHFGIELPHSAVAGSQLSCWRRYDCSTGVKSS